MPRSSNLIPDCANRFGLCCTALPFTSAGDFPVSKPSGQPCENLQDDDRCGIHSQLRESGWKGCTVSECFGAGQQVSQVTFGGVSWRDSRATADAMFAVFPIMHRIHEMLFLLGEALAMTPSDSIREELITAREDLNQLAEADADVLRAVDIIEIQQRISPLLRQASKEKRTAQRHAGNPAALPRNGIRAHAELAGASLRDSDLRAEDLRGACLIAADLRGSDLRFADMLGADLRGADLSTALLLAQPQINAASGDVATKIRPGAQRPSHWR